MLITCLGGGNHGQILAPVEELLASRIPDDEKRRIESHKFYLVSAPSPSGTATLRGNPFPTDRHFHLLVVEWKFLNSLRAQPDELAAILLHEIGHTLNPPPQPNVTEAEHHADDYARYCRFGQSLGRNLMNCLGAGMEGFDRSMTEERIRRIEANDPLKLNLIAPYRRVEAMSNYVQINVRFGDTKRVMIADLSDDYIIEGRRGRLL